MNLPEYVIISICCEQCKEITAILNVNLQKYHDWMNGESVQKAFPDMSASNRELLISATCAKCFDLMFPPEEEDENL